MKKHLLTKTFLFLAFLIWANVGWAQETVIYTTGFESAEGFTAGTVYNNTNVAYTGPVGKQWGTYYGTPATTGFITGAQSMQMRYYTTAPTNFGYTFTNFDLPKVTKVTFKAKDNASISDVTVSYSTNGGSSYTGDQTFVLTTTSAPFEYIVSATGEYANVRIKFTLAGTTVAERLIIDDIIVYGIDDVAPVATWSPANTETYVAVNSPVTITFNEAIRDIATNVNFDNTTVDALITSFETVVGATPVTFDATIDATNKIITVTPAADLADNTEYTITLAAVEDAVNNATTGETVTFTTIDPSVPNITNVAITEVAPYYAGDNITVTWSQANIDFVKIEAWVPSESIWLEMIASTDATDGSEVISIPADAMYSTAYKVRVSYVTTPTVNAESSTFTIIATPTINDIQSNMSDGDRSEYNGQIVRFDGIVTAEKSSGSGYFVQDGVGANNGVYVYAAVTAVAVGDSVTIQGTVFEYLSTTLYLTQITSPTVTIKNSGNTLPDLATITTGDLLEAYEGVLIKMVNTEVITGNDGFNVFTINDGTGVTSADDELYLYTPTVGNRITISGLGYYSYGAFKILPRSASDVVSAVDTVGSTVYTVDQGALTITNIPYSTDLATFEGNITPAIGATWDVYDDAGGTTSATVLDDTKLLIVTAADGITSSTYAITRNAVRTGKDILTYSFTEQTGAATMGDGTIDIEVSSSTDRSDLVATFTISDGASIAIVADVQESGVTHNNFTNPVTYTVTAEDGLTKDWIVTVTNTAVASTEAEFLTFTVLGEDAVIDNATDAITLTLPYSTDLTTLVASYTLSTGAIASIGVVDQESGVTENNFTNPVIYRVTAEDDVTFIDWTVTITTAEPSTDATVSSTTYTVDNGLETITNVPWNETLVAFKSKITPAAEATFEVYQSNGTTVASDLLSGYKLICTAQDGSTTKTYTITLNEEPVSNALYVGFDYTVGSALQTQTGWTALNSGDDLIIATDNLSYSGLKAPTGNKVTFDGGGIDAYYAFDSVKVGTVFASFIFKVTDQSLITDLTDGGYFAALADNTTSYDARIWVRPNPTAASSTFDIGFGNVSSVPPTTSGTFNIGDAIFVVMSYNVDNGEVSAWINPSSADFGGTAPTATLTSTAATPAFSISKFFIRQDSQDETPTMEIDELRIGATWADVTPIASTNPETSVNVTSLPDFGNIVQNTVGSTEVSFNVSGLNLSNDLVVTPPAGFEISTVSGVGFTATNPITLIPTSGTVSSTPIYVKFHPTAVQAYTGNITISSVGVSTDKTVAVTGTGVASDDVAPSFVATYPKTANVETTSFDVLVEIDEVGKVWFLEQESGTAAPTSAVVKSTGTLITAAIANIEYSATITDLSLNTTYDVYFVAEDNQATPNLSATPVMISETTLSITEVTIHDIQYTTATPAESPYFGEQIKTSGIVIAEKTGTVWIQDGAGEWNGVMVYSSATETAVNVGDEIEFLADVDEYYGLTELKNVTNLEIISTGNTLPVATTIPENTAITEGFESVLINIENLEVTELGGEHGIIYTSTNGTATVKVDNNIYAQTDMVVGDIYTITGIGYYSYDEFRISPRDILDITEATGINNPSGFVTMNIYPNPSNGQFTLELNAQKAGTFNVEIVNISGQVVFEKQIVQDGISTIDISNRAKGMYYIRINDGTSVNVQKIVIQ